MCQNNAVNRDITNAIGLALQVGIITGSDPIKGAAWNCMTYDDQIDLIDAAAKMLDQATTAAGFWERYDWELSLRALAVDLVELPRETLTPARVLAACTVRGPQ